jgi:methylmalonyl-CoA/ethylmalonyl-CoA epimerase
MRSVALVGAASTAGRPKDKGRMSRRDREMALNRLRRVFELIDHVGVAVTDLDASISLYEDTFGMPLVHRETVSEQGVEAALLDVGDGHVELLLPLGEETPVGKFVAKRGQGHHHVAYRVGDIDATRAGLKEKGIELIDEEARTGIRQSRVAFLHPRSTGGVLTEIVEPAEVH